jgi:acyl carrier protein
MSKISLEKIISIISKNIDVDEKKIDINSKSDDFYKWDSLTQVTIILDIEKVLGKKINAAKIGELDSIKKIVAVLKKI